MRCSTNDATDRRSGRVKHVLHKRNIPSCKCHEYPVGIVEPVSPLLSTVFVVQDASDTKTIWVEGMSRVNILSGECQISVRNFEWTGRSWCYLCTSASSTQRFEWMCRDYPWSRGCAQRFVDYQRRLTFDECECFFGVSLLCCNMLAYVLLLYKFAIHDVFVASIFLRPDIGWTHHETALSSALVLILYFGAPATMFIWRSLVLNLVDWTWWLNRSNIDLVSWWDNLKAAGEPFSGIYHLCRILHSGHKTASSFLMVGHLLDLASTRIERFVGFSGRSLTKSNFEVGFGCYHTCPTLVSRLKFTKVEPSSWADQCKKLQFKD